MLPSRETGESTRKFWLKLQIRQIYLLPKNLAQFSKEGQNLFNNLVIQVSNTFTKLLQIKHSFKPSNSIQFGFLKSFIIGMDYKFLQLF